MTADDPLARLDRLSRMILELRLSELRQAAAERDRSRAALAALDRPPTAAPDPELSPIAEARAAVGYQAWADRRRAEINPVLARQTAAWLARREEASRAFGRVQALSALMEREARRR